ncbi:hypothetical protein JQ607_18975 [Bradyrhizobium liaoningense]|nr:hypothetical protein [Bradyrhizobium liaoningense]MBR0842286.1 hypothetical protein [Bradyrhizobium liaoningense]
MIQIKRAKKLYLGFRQFVDDAIVPVFCPTAQLERGAWRYGGPVSFAHA